MTHIERVARAMAESAGFCWENCAQSQWKRDAKAGLRILLNDLAEWCEAERSKLGSLDGYDYRSGQEYGLRCAQLHIDKITAALPLEDRK